MGDSGAVRPDREKILAAARALQQVGSRAWVFASMPVVEGVTPRALLDPETSVSFPTDEPLPRRHGYFRLDEIGLSCLDHVALYGDACFEGILVPHGHVFLFREHLWRLWRSASRLRIAIPYAMEDLTWEILQTTSRVGYGPQDTGYIRFVLSRGMGDLGINPAKCVGATVYSLSSTISLYPREMYESGIELGLTRQIRRPDERMLDPTVKSNNYMNNVLALMEGTGGRRLMESLVLTRHGFIAEATVDNIFSIQREPGWERHPDRVVVRTPRRAYCLNGITRALVLHVAGRKGYRVLDEEDMLPIDLIGADREAFMTGTGCGVMPIIALDGHEIGGGRPGEVTRGLIEEVRAAMANPEFGLRIGASREEVRDYLAAPSPIGADSAPEALPA